MTDRVLSLTQRLSVTRSALGEPGGPLDDGSAAGGREGHGVAGRAGQEAVHEFGHVSMVAEPNPYVQCRLDR